MTIRQLATTIVYVTTPSSVINKLGTRFSRVPSPNSLILGAWGGGRKHWAWLILQGNNTRLHMVHKCTGNTDVRVESGGVSRTRTLTRLGVCDYTIILIKIQLVTDTCIYIHFSFLSFLCTSCSFLTIHSCKQVHVNILINIFLTLLYVSSSINCMFDIAHNLHTYIENTFSYLIDCTLEMKFIANGFNCYSIFLWMFAHLSYAS